MRRTALLALWGLTLLPAARGDVVTLKDGSKVEGEVRKTDGGWTIKTADGKTVNVDAAKVKSLEAKRSASANNPADDAMRGLISLRRSVESQADVNKILERYRKFIEQHVGTPAADEALKDIGVWEKRLEQGMVKLGDRWITQQQQGEIQERAMDGAAEARRLLVQGRLKEATAAIDAALTDNPVNAAALYLRGVVLFRQEQTANARKAFEASAQFAPNHGPTFNNLAVILWGSKQFPGAMNYYGQAMNAAAGTRQILDNVAEALNELPEAQRDNAGTKKVVLLFNAQDMAMQAKMKKRGLFRWGSTWVDEKTLKQLNDEEARVQDKLAKMEDEYEQVQDRGEQIERDIGDTERSIRRIEASSYGRDSAGRPVKMSYPRLYYDLKRDLEQLHNERESEKEKAVRLKKKAKQVQQELSVPRYAGVQQIIGVEGAPELPPLTDADLAGRPASRPTTVRAAAEASALSR